VCGWGSTLDISTDDGPISVTVTGIVNDQDGPLKADLYASETLFPALGNIAESVDMVAAVNGDATAVASRLRKAVPEGSVKTGSDHLRDVRLQSAKGIDNFQKLVSAFAGISLAVGALVFANTLTILLTQRTCDLALLRCVGATRTQVTRSVLIEGLLIGALGSLMGIAAGYLISWGGIAALHALSPGTPMGSPTFSLWELAVPLTAGVGVTAVASYLPARRAAAHSPLQALEPLEPTGPRSKD
jgi:putative ABC transport system permease protein